MLDPLAMCPAPCTSLVFFNRVHQPLPPPRALFLQEKSQNEPELPPRLQQAREDAVSLALAAGVVQQECGLQLTPEEFVTATLNFGLMEVGGVGWSVGGCLVRRGGGWIGGQAVLPQTETPGEYAHNAHARSLTPLAHSPRSGIPLPALPVAGCV